MNKIDEIFSEYKDLPVWCCFIKVPVFDKDGNVKRITKPPVSPRTLWNVKIDDPKALGTYEECAAQIGKEAHVRTKTKDGPKVESGEVAGVGLVIGETDLFALDLDHVLNVEDEEVVFTNDVAASINEIFADTYQELSPSRTGLRIIGRGASDDLSRAKKFHLPNGEPDQHIEFFHVTGYVTITGDAINDRPITSMDKQFNKVHKRFVELDKQPKTFTDPARSAAQAIGQGGIRVFSDEEALERLLGPKNQYASEAAYLWEGNDGGDHSKAVYNLCVYLAWATNYNRDQVDRLFRLSGLMYPKWDETGHWKAEPEKTYGDDILNKTVHPEKALPDYTKEQKREYAREKTMNEMMKGFEEAGEEATEQMYFKFDMKTGEQTGLSSWPFKAQDYDPASEIIIKAEDEAAARRKFETQKKIANKFLGEQKAALTPQIYMKRAHNGDALDDLLKLATGPEKPQKWATGFGCLDELLGGGFKAGDLIVLGAISSLGKTTWVLQICQQMAAAGKDVLFFSLEMSKNEINAKAISRYSDVIADQRIKEVTAIKKGFLNPGDVSEIKAWRSTANEIVSGEIGAPGSGKRNLFTDAFNAVKQLEDHFYIYKGLNDVNIDRIEEAVNAHVAATGNRPFVVLDYLQILKPSDEAIERRYDKRLSTADDTSRLKNLAVKHDIPILAISSVSRTYYTEPVSMGIFKEAGEIEYSSDIAIGLQYPFMNYDTHPKQSNGGATMVYESSNIHNARVRKMMADQEEAAANGADLAVELKIMKNRMGIKGHVYFNFCPAYNAFRPIGMPYDEFEEQLNTEMEKYREAEDEGKKKSGQNSQTTATTGKKKTLGSL